MTHYRDFHLQPIAGQWCRGAAGKNLLVSNPFDGALLQEIPQANCADLDAAYREAARVQPQWAALGPSARAAVLHQVVAVFDRRREEIIEWIIRESGSTRLKAQLEWGAARAIALESASFPARVHGRIVESDVPGKESRVYRSALGVVGVISRKLNWPAHKVPSRCTRAGATATCWRPMYMVR
jgi:aldehyde dehydrogenase (NAD+)